MRAIASASAVILLTVFWCRHSALAADLSRRWLKLDFTVPATVSFAPQEVLLGVQINGQQIADAALLLRGADNTFYASQRDLQSWRLQLPGGTAIQHQGESYVPLSAFAGLTSKLNEQAQTLTVQAPAQAFQGSSLVQGQAPGPVPARADVGGFMNYDVFTQYTPGAGNRTVSGLLEVGFFKGDLGVGVSNFLAQNTDNTKHFLRLDTTWTKDDPQKRASLRVGDTISRSAATWGRSVRLGGIQYATNFSTQPYISNYPLQRVVGVAALPSTVDVFVNNTLLSRKALPPGPFAIRDLPAITGGGEMRVVVRDLLGREQVVNQPYYASASLLRSGVVDFSYEAGFLRQNYGLFSNDYGRWLAAATYRRGLSEQFTAEVHAEAAQGGQGAVGLAGTYLQPSIGVFNIAAAGSVANEASGQLLALSYERNVLGEISVNARSQWASQNFTQAGLTPTESAPKRLSTASLSYSAGRLGAVSLGYISQDSRERERVEVLSAGYNTALFGRATLNISMLRSLTGASTTNLFAIISFPLGERISGSVSMRSDETGGRRDNEVMVQAQQNLPLGEGYGWNVRAGSLGSEAVGAVYQNNYGTYRVDAAHARGQDVATRANVSGGVAFIGGGIFPGRRISDSFGVVQMPDFPGTQVYADNQPVARIDANGNAFLPRLRAYEKNRISINQNDLPLDAKIDALNLEVTPYFRSGLVLTFPIKRASGGLVRIMLEDGKPLPAGAIVRVEGQTEEFPVALEGEAYLTALKEHNRLRAEWRGHGCDLELARPISNDPLPHLGTLICKGVQR